jgi:DNA-binding NtrC family response regulator
MTILRSKTKHRIFVVDDEEIISATVALILQRSGLHATSITDSLKSLDATATDPPDRLISHVVMAGMSGIDLPIRFKETYPLCGVLLFSGQA